MNDLKKNVNDTDEFLYKCNGLHVLSEVFHCCGYHGSSDFGHNMTVASTCCNPEYTDGCANITVSAIKKNVVFFIVVPNGTVLAIELALILMVPFLIGRISRSTDEERWLLAEEQPYQSRTTGISIYSEPYLNNNRGNKVY